MLHLMKFIITNYGETPQKELNQAASRQYLEEIVEW